MILGWLLRTSYFVGLIIMKNQLDSVELTITFVGSMYYYTTLCSADERCSLKPITADIPYQRFYALSFNFQ